MSSPLRTFFSVSLARIYELIRSSDCLVLPKRSLMLDAFVDVLMEALHQPLCSQVDEASGHQSHDRIKAARSLPPGNSHFSGALAPEVYDLESLLASPPDTDAEREYFHIHSLVSKLCADEIRRLAQGAETTRSPTSDTVRCSDVRSQSLLLPCAAATARVAGFTREVIEHSIRCGDLVETQSSEEGNTDDIALAFSQGGQTTRTLKIEQFTSQRDEKHKVEDHRLADKDHSFDPLVHGMDEFSIREDAFDRAEAMYVHGRRRREDRKNSHDGENDDDGFVDILNGDGTDEPEEAWEVALRDVLLRCVQSVVVTGAGDTALSQVTASDVQCSRSPHAQNAFVVTMTHDDKAKLVDWIGGSRRSQMPTAVVGSKATTDVDIMMHDDGQRSVHNTGDGDRDGYNIFCDGDAASYSSAGEGEVWGCEMALSNELVRHCVRTLGERLGERNTEERKQQSRNQPQWMQREHREADSLCRVLAALVPAPPLSAPPSLTLLYLELLSVIPPVELLACSDTVELGMDDCVNVNNYSQSASARLSVPGWKAVLDGLVYTVVIPCVIKLMRWTILAPSSKDATKDEEYSQRAATIMNQIDSSLQFLGRLFHAQEATPELLSTVLFHFTHILQFICAVCTTVDWSTRTPAPEGNMSHYRKLNAVRCFQLYHTKLLALYWRLCVTLSPYGGLAVHNHDRCCSHHTQSSARNSISRSDAADAAGENETNITKDAQQNTIIAGGTNGSMAGTCHAHCWMYYSQATAALLIGGILHVWLLHCRPLYSLPVSSAGDALKILPPEKAVLADQVDPLCAWLRLYWLGGHNQYFYHNPACHNRDEQCDQESNQPTPINNGTSFPLVRRAIAKVLSWHSQTEDMEGLPVYPRSFDAGILNDYCSYFPLPLTDRYFVCSQPDYSNDDCVDTEPEHLNDYSLMKMFQQLTEASFQLYVKYEIYSAVPSSSQCYSFLSGDEEKSYGNGSYHFLIRSLFLGPSQTHLQCENLHFTSLRQALQAFI